MDFLRGMALATVIAVGGVYLAGQYNEYKAERTAMNLAAIQLCLHKRAEAASYRGSMDWTGAKFTYKTGDEYCH